LLQRARLFLWSEQAYGVAVQIGEQTKPADVWNLPLFAHDFGAEFHSLFQHRTDIVNRDVDDYVARCDLVSSVQASTGQHAFSGVKSRVVRAPTVIYLPAE